MDEGRTDVSDDDQQASTLQRVDAEDEGDYTGDYSTRMEEIMGDATGSEEPNIDDDDEDEGFVYQGVDAEPQGAYQDQLRDILGAGPEDDELEEKEVEKSFRAEESEVVVVSPARIAVSTRPLSRIASTDIASPKTCSLTWRLRPRGLTPKLRPHV
jgi:hypothetical protein